MIVDRLDRIGAYAALSSNFAAAARWLAETDLHALAPGRYEIDGDRVFASLQDNWLERDTPAFESHHLYSDLQLVLSGRERFLLGWTGREGAAAPGADYYPSEAEDTLSFTLEPDQFVIFLPGELHSPGNPDGAPALCRKLVVKVRRED